MDDDADDCVQMVEYADARTEQGTRHAAGQDDAPSKLREYHRSEGDLSVSETSQERLDEPGDGDARGVDVEIGDEDRTDGECKYKVEK